jgi:4,5-dihydroxyphthalate decarboxylase
LVKKQRVEASIALSQNARTAQILDGSLTVEGLRLIPTVVHPSEMFWRQLHFGDFDISEMSMSLLLIAAARGDRSWVALPIYTMRRFFHTSILVRKGAGIDAPQDLRGRRVGVPEYQQTSAIWARGVLQDSFGVEAKDIEWHMERGPDRSHGSATGFTPPEGVVLNQIPPEKDIGTMLANGELVATLLYLNDRNLVDRARLDISEFTEPLFRDPLAEGRRFHAETGLYPINHTVVVRRTLLERHPWIALNLFKAFEKAREDLQAAAASWIQGFVETGAVEQPSLLSLGADPMSYGFAQARRELEAVARYVHQQGLTAREVRLDEIFAESTLHL